MPESVNLMSFGASLDAGFNNLAALKAACAAAISNQCKLVLPAGTINVTFPSGGSILSPGNSVFVNGNLTVEGMGREATVIRVGPDDPKFGFALFNQDPGSDLSLKGLTIQGPVIPAFSGAQINPFNYGIYIRGGPGAGSTTLYETNIFGKFSDCIFVYSGSEDATTRWQFRIEHAELDSQGDSIAFFGTPVSVKAAVLNDIDFWVHGIPLAENVAKGGAQNTWGMGAYIHPNISLDANNLRFHRTVGQCIKHYSGLAIQESSTPMFARYSNIWVGPDVAEGFVTSNSGPSTFTNCTFNNKTAAIEFRDSALITNCVFKNKQPSFPTLGTSSSYTVQFNNCIFDQPGNCISSTAKGDETTRWTLQGCEFFGGSPSSYTLLFSPGERSRVYLDGCKFFQTNLGALVNGSCKTKIDNCVFAGKSPAGILNIYNGSGALSINNSTFEPQVANAVRNDSPDVVIKGAGNTFEGGVNGPYNTVAFDNFKLGEGQSPKVLTAAAKINPDPNYDVIHVSGVTRIDNILLGNSQPRQNAFGGADLTIILDNSGSFSNIGNITPKSMTPRAPGTVVNFVYDGSAKRWRER